MLQAHGWQEIPTETKRIAHAAFPNGNLVMKMRDELGMVYAMSNFRIYSLRAVSLRNRLRSWLS